ncbi:hypothetical protein KFE25_012750 [Diacronema lutheri]|uniref:F-box domain-containing protein n=1 Tax=Diacronema lutheri TaxID=2081491 RepID=A0A8J6C5F9_DIALT|nr:hypothetical protein KFE25_012750 [Diacronema lutheri]
MAEGCASSSLEDDLVEHILAHLPSPAAWRCRLVCRAWARAVASASLYAWRASSLQLDLVGCAPLDERRARALVGRLHARPPCVTRGAVAQAAKRAPLRIRLDGLRWSRLDGRGPASPAGSAHLVLDVLRAHGSRATLVELSLRGCEDLSATILLRALTPSRARQPAPRGARADAPPERSTGGAELRALDLAGCQSLAPLAGCADWIWPSLAHACPRLESLDVSGALLREPSAHVCAIVDSFGRTLRRLSLAHSRLGLAGARAVCDALARAHAERGHACGALPLRDLCLADCELPSAALEPLARLVGVGALTTGAVLELRALSLADNVDLDDEAPIVALLCAPGMRELSSLDLSATSLRWAAPARHDQPHDQPSGQSALPLEQRLAAVRLERRDVEGEGVRAHAMDGGPSTVAAAIATHCSLQLVAVRGCPALGGAGVARLAHARQQLRARALAHGPAGSTPPLLTVEADAATISSAAAVERRLARAPAARASDPTAAPATDASVPAESWEALAERAELPPLAALAQDAPAALIPRGALEELGRPLSHPPPRSIFFVSAGPPPPSATPAAADCAADCGWRRLGDARAAATAARAAERAAAAPRRRGGAGAGGAHGARADGAARTAQSQPPRLAPSEGRPDGQPSGGQHGRRAQGEACELHAFFFAQRARARFQTGHHAGMRL